MATIQLKRKLTGAVGAPPASAAGEPIFSAPGFTGGGANSLWINNGTTQVPLVDSNRQVELAGVQTITGPKTFAAGATLTLGADPLAALEAATKQYVDTKAATSTTLTDGLTITGTGLAGAPIALLPSVFGTGLTWAPNSVTVNVATAAEIAAGALNTSMVTPLGLRGELGAAGTTLVTTAKTVVPALNEIYSRIEQLVGVVIFAGTYDATTNTGVFNGQGGIPAGTTALPAASVANHGAYVIVTVAGTGVAPAPVEPIAVGDWLQSDGTGWLRLAFAQPMGAYLPLSGGVLTGDLRIDGVLTARPPANAAGAGGVVDIRAGDGGGAGPLAWGGDLILWGGNGAPAAGGGWTRLRGGDGGATSGAGGGVSVDGGTSTVGTAGGVTITGGANTGALAAGEVQITGGAQNSLISNNGVTILGGPAPTAVNASGRGVEIRAGDSTGTGFGAEILLFSGSGPGVTSPGYARIGQGINFQTAATTTGSTGTFIVYTANGVADQNSGYVSITTGGVTGTGVPGKITLAAGLNTDTNVRGQIELIDLPIITQPNANAVWNNNGVLNIGAGAAAVAMDFVPLVGGQMTGPLNMAAGSVGVNLLAGTDLYVMGAANGVNFVPPTQPNAAFGGWATQNIGFGIDDTVTPPRLRWKANGIDLGVIASGVVGDYVAKTGDTMTGHLIIDPSAAPPNWGLAYRLGLTIGTTTTDRTGIKFLSSGATAPAFALYTENDQLYLCSGTANAWGGYLMSFMADAIALQAPMTANRPIILAGSGNDATVQGLDGNTNQTGRPITIRGGDANGAQAGGAVTIRRGANGTTVGLQAQLSLTASALLTGGQGNATTPGQDATVSGGSEQYPGQPAGSAVVEGGLASNDLTTIPGDAIVRGGRHSMAGGPPGNTILMGGTNNDNSLFGAVKLRNLPIVTQADVETIWNNNGVLNIGAGGTSGITDAPVDTTFYGRMDGAWQRGIASFGNTTITGQYFNLLGDIGAGVAQGTSMMLRGGLGGGATGRGGNMTIQAGTGGSTGPGGNLDLSGGGSNGGGLGGGGHAVLQGGSGTNAPGGNVTLMGGIGTSGGDVAITGADSTNGALGSGGGITLTAGASPDAIGGAVSISGGQGVTYGGSVTLEAGNGATPGTMNIVGAYGGGGEVRVESGTNTTPTGNAGTLRLIGGGASPTGTGLGGDIVLTPGKHGSASASGSGNADILMLLPITARTNPNAVWNNNGVLNTGAGGLAGLTAVTYVAGVFTGDGTAGAPLDIAMVDGGTF